MLPTDRSAQLLHCGNIEADEGFFTRGGGTSTKSNPNPESQRRKGVIISVLIEHPTEGLLLFETGGGENYPEVWGVSFLAGSRLAVGHTDSLLAGAIE